MSVLAFGVSGGQSGMLSSLATSSWCWLRLSCSSTWKAGFHCVWRPIIFLCLVTITSVGGQFTDFNVSLLLLLLLRETTHREY